MNSPASNGHTSSLGNGDTSNLLGGERLNFWTGYETSRWLLPLRVRTHLMIKITGIFGIGR